MSNPKPMPTDEFLRQENATRLIRELAVRPPVKGMASVKAATEVFAANVPDADPAGGGDPAEHAAAGVDRSR